MQQTLGCSRFSDRFGFSLLELLVVLAILSFVAALAAPGVGATMDRMRTSSMSEELESVLNRLPLEAMAQGAILRVEATSLRARLPGWPADWQLRVEPELEYGPTGQASGGIVSLAQAGGRSFRWRVEAVTGQVLRMP